MHRFKSLSSAGVAALVASAHILPTSAFASPVVPKGTLVGNVMCGAGPAAHAVVSIDGTGLGTHTDGSGQFRIDVPAQWSMTVETLDIGSLNLQVCLAPVPADTIAPDEIVQSPNGERTYGGT